MQKLYLQKNKGSTISIKEACSIRNNLAWIVDSRDETYLNFKAQNEKYINGERYLIGDIFKRTAKHIKGLGKWEYSMDGKLSSRNASGYEGWLTFNNLEEAKKFLELECGYNLVYCK